jgi:ribosomal-protein-alanine N-acetyltransferase
LEAITNYLYQKLHIVGMKTYVFESSRLGFRNWLDSDRVPFAKMGKDASVMEFFPKLLTDQESEELVERIKAHFKEKGYGLYAVDRLDTQTFIGFIGFSTPGFQADFTPCTEIGWRLRQEAWGQGFATEGALRCLEYGFATYNFPEIFSFTAEINQRSVRVMQKIGMHPEGAFDHPLLEDGSRLKKHVLYKIGKN